MYPRRSCSLTFINSLYTQSHTLKCAFVCPSCHTPTPSMLMEATAAPVLPTLETTAQVLLKCEVRNTAKHEHEPSFPLLAHSPDLMRQSLFLEAAIRALCCRQLGNKAPRTRTGTSDAAAPERTFGFRHSPSPSLSRTTDNSVCRRESPNAPSKKLFLGGWGRGFRVSNPGGTGQSLPYRAGCWLEGVRCLCPTHRPQGNPFRQNCIGHGRDGKQSVSRRGKTTDARGMKRMFRGQTSGTWWW